MSREIKFRAWDEKNKQFADYEDIEECLYCQSRDGWRSSDGMGCCFGINAVEILADCIIEQYTGLKDKNGKEIYEGDIVALLFGYVPMKSVTTENIRIENAQKAVIHFDTARAAFRYTIKQRTPRDCQFKPGTKTNIVVIGNIHENSELLGGKDGE